MPTPAEYHWIWVEWSRQGSGGDASKLDHELVWPASLALALQALHATSPDATSPDMGVPPQTRAASGSNQDFIPILSPSYLAYDDDDYTGPMRHCFRS